MNVQLNGIEKNRVDKTDMTYDTVKNTTNTAQSGKSGWNQDVAFGTTVAKNADTYANPGKSKEEVQSEIGATDVTTMQNYMTVMSNTLSDEDYAALSEEGYKPGEMSVEETVTVVDEIKAKLAEAGIVIEGYNDNLDVEKLEKITNNSGYAQAIADSFQKYQVEPTEENVRDLLKELEKMQEVTDFSEDAKKYMLQNELPVTTDSLFKAAFSSQIISASQSNLAIGTKGEALNTDAFQGQIEKIIEEAKLPVDSTTKAEAAWILQNDLPLTRENLTKLHEMNQLSFPVAVSEITDAAARAIVDGKRPKDGDLMQKETLLEQAVTIKEEVAEISDEAVVKAVQEEKPVQIETLYEIQSRLFQKENKKKDTTVEAQTELTPAQDKKYVTTKRQLEEIRLRMTVNMNYQLLKKGIQIDVSPLEKVIAELKAQEEQTATALFGEETEKYSLWKETDLKVAQLKMMPAALVGSMLLQEGTTEEATAKGELSSVTLRMVHESGTFLKNTYEAANQSYEALMTAPRKDLGDSIKEAFRNVDDILSDLGQEITKESERAVRILGYNQMEITPQQISQVMEADETLQKVLEKMTPAATLAMIRDGVNPLDTGMNELYEYLQSQDQPLTEEVEKYSKFLYQLEKDQQITQEEKESYIGIYRMLRQIEKTDGAAVGTVVHNGQEMSFANLLSAVRTRRTNGVNQTAGNDTGFQSEVIRKEKSISDQIATYFEAFASEETEQGYQEEQLQGVREALKVSAEALETLMAYDQSVSPDHLLAQSQLMNQRGGMFQNLYQEDEKQKLRGKSGKLLENFTDAEHAMEAYDEVVEGAREVVWDVLNQKEASYIDVKSMVLTCKQLSLSANLAKEENYEVPVLIEGEMTAVNIKITHNKGEKGLMEATFESESYGTVKAAFSLQADQQIQGFVASSSEEGVLKLSKIDEKICANLLKETGKNADVTYVHQTKGSIKEGNRRTDTDSNVSTKELYRIAKGFLETFAD